MKRWVGERHAQLSLLVLLTQPLFYIGAQFANLDMLVAGCITATILQLAHVCLQTEQGNRPRAALAGAYVCAALGVLAKGLIGLAIPVLVIAAWLLAGRRHRLVVSLLWAPGIAILALVGAPWFLAMQWQFSDFTRYFFMLQQFERFVGGGFNNAQPWWFFLAALPILALPWALWVPLAIRRARGDDPTRMRVRRLMWCWLDAVLLFFSVPQSKLIGYVLPAAPPLAFLIADAACPILQGRAGVRRLWFTSLGLAGVICVGVVTAFAIQQPKSQRPVGEYLAAHRASHEPVVFLDDYFFESPSMRAWIVPP